MLRVVTAPVPVVDGLSVEGEMDEVLVVEEEGDCAATGGDVVAAPLPPTEDSAT